MLGSVAASVAIWEVALSKRILPWMFLLSEDQSRYLLPRNGAMFAIVGPSGSGAK